MLDRLELYIPGAIGTCMVIYNILKSVFLGRVPAPAPTVISLLAMICGVSISAYLISDWKSQ